MSTFKEGNVSMPSRTLGHICIKNIFLIGRSDIFTASKILRTKRLNRSCGKCLLLDNRGGFAKRSSCRSN